MTDEAFGLQLFDLIQRFVIWQREHQTHWQDYTIAPLERAARLARERDFLQNLIVGNLDSIQQARMTIGLDGAAGERSG